MNTTWRLGIADALATRGRVAHEETRTPRIGLPVDPRAERIRYVESDEHNRGIYELTPWGQARLEENLSSARASASDEGDEQGSN